MARRSNSTTLSQRDFQTQSLTRLLTLPIIRPMPPVLVHPPTRSEVLEVGDRRLFTPDRSTRPPRAARPGAARVIAATYPGSAVRFKDPRAVTICVRRKIRREVIFALGKRGKGARSPRKRNFWSEVRC